jgi:hypothetical protein
VADKPAVGFGHKGKFRDIVAARAQTRHKILFVAVRDFGRLKGGLDQIKNCW